MLMQDDCVIIATIHCLGEAFVLKGGIEFLKLINNDWRGNSHPGQNAAFVLALLFRFFPREKKQFQLSKRYSKFLPFSSSVVGHFHAVVAFWALIFFQSSRVCFGETSGSAQNFCY